MRKSLCFFVAFLFLLSTLPAHALSEIPRLSDASQQAYAIEQVQETIAEIETYFEEMGSSIENENCNYLMQLQSMKDFASGAAEKEKLQTIIENAEALFACYSNYKNGISAYGSFHPIYSPAVSAIVTYFSGNGYLLAAELLAQSANNNVLDSIYYPTFGSNVEYSPITKNIRSSPSTSGSGTYESNSSSYLQDLHYAINKFSWVKDNLKITISDRYDYAVSDYSGIAGAAVNTMFLAQDAGAIVPFQVRINISK